MPLTRAPSTSDAGPGPIGPAAFAARMEPLGPFERPPTVAVAVSGGADSLALVLLADEWARARGGCAVALTVDHGLRPESAREAGRVAGWMAARGIGHCVLTWAGPKPATGLQEAARTARYALLAAWCARRGVLHLLLAHHADDQRETAALRAARGSGPDGLAAMAAIRELDAVRLLRPLLDLPKSALEATCRARNQDWIVDPSNADPRFARARLRRAGADLPDPAAIGEAVRARARLDAVAAGLLARQATFHPEGWIALRPAALDGVEPAAAARILARCVMAVGGVPYPPRRERLDRLLADLRGRSQGDMAAGGARTLAGCLVVPASGGWRVLREPRAVQGPVPVEPGLTVLWDGRFVIAVGNVEGAVVGALGAEAWRRLRADAPVPLPAAVGATLPAIRRDGVLLGVPHLGVGPAGGRDLDCRVWFRPPEPVAAPRFSVV